jgi:hypothetical protein
MSYLELQSQPHLRTEEQAGLETFEKALLKSAGLIGNAGR